MKYPAQGVKEQIIFRKIAKIFMWVVNLLMSITSLVYISLTFALSIMCVYYAFSEEPDTFIMIILIVYGCEAFITIFPKVKFIYDLLFK
jgi:hypothetical protein